MGGASMVKNLRRFFTSLGLEAMPFIPLSREWYRKILVKDSESRYKTGRWAWLNEISFAHNYSLIKGCCEYYKSKDRKILDVGCGEGILQKRMDYSKYTGVDMNTEAIRHARTRENENTEFVLAEAGQEYQPHGLYDVIVFNESLYYIKNPADVFLRYRTFLAEDGIIIVSMFKVYLARKIWKSIQKTGMKELTEVEVINEIGLKWMIKVYANAQLSGIN